MDKKALKTLEYDKVIAQLSGYATTPAGKSMCESLRPSSDIARITQAQTETADALSRILRRGSISFSGVKNIRVLLKRLEIGASLSPGELLTVRTILQVAGRAITYDRESRQEDQRDSLHGLFLALTDVPMLRAEIDRCIISEDEISDDASPTLRQLRRQIASSSDRIRGELNAILNKSSMQTYLQDHVITMRGEHYCLPVKAEYRSQVPGVIHDQSSTGSTLFIEPASVVKLSNDVKTLYLKEQDEIDKILRNLSDETGLYADALLADQQTLVQLDFIFAKGLFAEKLRATEPVFRKDGCIILKKARHPMLDPQTVVPIDLTLGETYRQLVVTGPNTGGKTVSLKTTGLLCLMGQAGLHIPASEHSELRVFREIYADIGDEQSIEQSLSTFSAHMTNIVSILEKAGKDTLVLLDELCAGTDPTEGAALAVSILTALREKQTLSMATTHYSEIKIYALQTDGVENASCEFNVDTLSPTYRLMTGIPGKSNAFAISGKLGLPEEIIEDARHRLEAEDEAFEDVIADLNIRRRALEDQERETRRLRDEAAKLEESLSRRMEKNDEMRARILSEAKEEAARILSEAKAQADASIRAIHKYGSDPDAVRKLEQERTKLRAQMEKTQSPSKASKKKQREESPVNHPDPKKLKIGDTVRVLSMNTRGTVHTLPDARGNLYVQMGLIRSKVNVTDLVLMQDPPDAVSKYKTRSRSERSGATAIRTDKSMNTSGEINLIGKRTDEALAELDKYLDDAYLSGRAEVRIVHGKGTGALRSAVQQHLKHLPYIESWHAGAYGEGDSGVTIAVFTK